MTKKSSIEKPKRAGTTRTLLTVYYKAGQRVKTNSSEEMRTTIALAKRHLEAKTYDADKVHILNRKTKNVKHEFVLNNGKAMPVAKVVKPTLPIVAGDVTLSKMQPAKRVHVIYIDNVAIGEVISYHKPARASTDQEFRFVPFGQPALIVNPGTYAEIIQQINVGYGVTRQTGSLIRSPITRG